MSTDIEIQDEPTHKRDESDDANRTFFSNRHDQRKFLNSITRSKKIEFRNMVRKFVAMCQDKEQSEAAQKLAVDIYTWIAANQTKPASSLQRFVQNENNKKMKREAIIQKDKESQALKESNAITD